LTIPTTPKSRSKSSRTPRWLAGGLAAAARVQILVSFYDGDPQLWQEAIERGETPADEADLAFLETMTQRIADDPRPVEDLGDRRRIRRARGTLA
jgi:hypothetical protein